MKDFITLSISNCEHAQKRQSYTYTTKITVLDMNRQGSILLITKPRSNKPFRNFSYHRRAASAWTYRVFFNLRTTSCCPPSLLKYQGSSMKNGSHVEYHPEQIHFWSQYFDFANLEYTAKSTSNSLWPTGPLENMSSGVWEIIDSGYPLLHNIVPWIS